MRFLLAGLLVLTLSGCNVFQSPKAEFWGRLKLLCGNSYAGELVSDDPQDEKFEAAELSVSFRECTDAQQIDMDFLVDGEPYSHWLLTRYDGMYELRHIHKDGVTGYGGFAAENSSGSRMNFPADDVTKSLFDMAGIPESKANTWAMEARAGSVFVYEMTRPGREFRVEFNTINPLTASTPDEE